MSEYIEREALMQAFSDYVWNSNHSDLVPAPTWNHAVEIVRDFPTSDMVDVVRCADCGHSTLEEEYVGRTPYCYWCGNRDDYFKADEYCSSGVRRNKTAGGDDK